MTKKDVLYLTRNTLTLGIYDNVVFINAMVSDLRELKTEWIDPDKDIMKVFNKMSAFWIACLSVAAVLNTVTLGIAKWIAAIFKIELPEVAASIMRLGYRDYLIKMLFEMDPRWFRKEKRAEALKIAANS